MSTCEGGQRQQQLQRQQQQPSSGSSSSPAAAQRRQVGLPASLDQHDGCDGPENGAEHAKYDIGVSRGALREHCMGQPVSVCGQAQSSAASKRGRTCDRSLVSVAAACSGWTVKAASMPKPPSPAPYT